jgi:hypothetical protein
VKTFHTGRQAVCSLACEAARRKAIGWYARQAAIAKPRRPREPLVLADFGTLTERERAIYMRARANALTYARDKAARRERALLAGLRVAS